MSTDAELLAKYANEGSQTAFAEIVKRHVDLVYRAALRRVGGDSALAEEIAQAVFTTLALKAHSLPRDTIMVAWLYATTRHHVRNAIRAQRRRWVRDHTAYFMHEASTPAGSEIEWAQLGPALDEAMRALGADDREAVHLRFFDRTSFRQIGAILQISDDTARKRVDRALEKLRARLAQRGITSTAGAVASLLAAQTTPAASATFVADLPAIALAGATATASSGGGAGAILLTFMSTTKLSLGLVGLIAVLATGFVWQKHRQLRVAEKALVLAHQQHVELSARLATAATAGQTISASASDPVVPPSAEPDPIVQGAVDLFERVASLKKKIAGRPDQQIPELRLVNDVQWIAAASMPLGSEPDLLRVFHVLRNYGKARLAGMLSPALAKYAAANQGQLPTHILQLAPYVDPSVDAAMLQRYQVIRSGRYDDTPPNLSLIGEVASVPGPFDSVVRASKQSSSVTNFPTPEFGALERAMDAFTRAHGGEGPTEPAQLIAFVSIPVEETTLRTFWNRQAARTSPHRIKSSP